MSIETALICIGVAFAIGFAFGRASFDRRDIPIQNPGEAILADALQKYFPAPHYHLMNHITLRVKDGTTQIDHVLLSRFGVFVIETKDYKGWIFASAKSTTWTQVLFTQKYSFQNPILQNFKHVRAVEDLLDFLPKGSVQSMVVFVGSADFKTEIPPGVFTTESALEYLRGQTSETISMNRLQFCVGRLETARLAVTGETDIEHVQNLRRRHGDA